MRPRHRQGRDPLEELTANDLAEFAERSSVRVTAVDDRWNLLRSSESSGTEASPIEYERHFYARAGLLEALVRDERVKALFERWANIADVDVLERNAVVFCLQQLKADWAWLPLELVAHFVSPRAVPSVLSQPSTEPRRFVLTLPPSFEVRDKEAERLLIQAWRSFAKEDRQRRRHEERFTTEEEREALRRWGSWYYRVQLKRPPDTRIQIAREKVGPEELPSSSRSFDTKDIRRGIEKASMLLDLTHYRLDPQRGLSKPSSLIQ